MIKFYNIWVVFTLALFYLGPIPWLGRADALVAGIVLASLVGFNIGNIVAKSSLGLTPHEFKYLKRPPVKWGLILVFLLLSQYHIQSVTGQSIFNPNDYSLQFNDVYIQYQDTLKNRSFSAGSTESLFLILKALLLPAIILLLVLNFRKSNITVLFIMLPFVASTFMRGTDKEGIDLGLYLLVLAYYHKILGRRAIYVLGIGGLLLLLFTQRKAERYGGVTLSCLPGSPDACMDYSSFYAINFGASIEFLRIALTNYVTQGYEGLHRAMQIPFEFNYGVGHMAPLKQKLCQVFELGCNTETFREKLPSLGWDTRYKWSSAYTAIANDFHWIFIPLYTFCLGILFGVSERAWFQFRDYLSLAVLMLITLFFVYSSANMQLTISLEWTATYVAVFVMQWVRVRPLSSASVMRPLLKMSHNVQTKQISIQHGG